MFDKCAYLPMSYNFFFLFCGPVFHNATASVRLFPSFRAAYVIVVITTARDSSSVHALDGHDIWKVFEVDKTWYWVMHRYNYSWCNDRGA